MKIKVENELTCQRLTRDEILAMLDIKPLSAEFYAAISRANDYARKTFASGVIFAQIGLDVAPCGINCKFCRLAAENFDGLTQSALTLEEVLAKAEELIVGGADEIFLMTTAQYDPSDLLRVGAAVRDIMPSGMRLVANTGDFDHQYAQKLVDAGFTGVYHICRLDEGVTTCATIAEREATLQAINAAKLELYYCVEPIGPEHTNAQIADEIERAIKYNVDVMAVMRRVNFSGSPLTSAGEISAARLAQICAVATLATLPKRAMGVHEPEIISLIAGANQIYAEAGANPRDLCERTEESRGFSIADARKMLKDSDWAHKFSG